MLENTIKSVEFFGTRQVRQALWHVYSSLTNYMLDDIEWGNLDLDEDDKKSMNILRDLIDAIDRDEHNEAWTNSRVTM